MIDILAYLIANAEGIKDHIPESASTATMVAGIFTAFKLWDRRMGKRRDRGLHSALQDLTEEVTKIRWYVTGPEGNGGLVEDVKGLSVKVSDLTLAVTRHLPPDDTQQSRIDLNRRR